MGHDADEQASLLVVDEGELVGWGMRTVFSSQPWVKRCLFASHESSAVELARRHRPDLAILGCGVSGSGSAGLSRRLREVSERTRIVLLADRADVTRETVWAAQASVVLLKSWPTTVLVDRVRQALREAPHPIDAPLCETQDLPSLSPQQHQVLRLIATGATNREIGEVMQLSHYTVQDHAKAVFRRLEARNRAQAVQRGQTLGFIG